MRRAGLSAIAVFVAVIAQSACWEVAGVEDREVTRCPSVFSSAVSPECAACLEESCCAELGRCADSLACRQCTIPSNGAHGCSLPAEFTDLASCVHDACAAACPPTAFQGLPEPYCDVFSTPSEGACTSVGDLFGRMNCNPISNEPCNGLDEVCAIAWGTLSWSCRATGHAVAVCDACGLVEGDCTRGHICTNGRCYRHCCDDGDCQPFGRCEYYPAVPVGVCVID